jgi:hypothetical protein
MILGFTWLLEHNLEIDWQMKEVQMSRCLLQCSTCRAEATVKRQAERVATAQIHACRAGSFPVLIEEIIDEDSYPPEGVSEPDRGVADDDAYFDNGFNNEIEDSDHIFVAHIHGKDGEHFIRAGSTVLQRLAEAFTRPHLFAMTSHPHYMNSKTYSVRAPSTISPNVENGTMPSNSSTNLHPGSERSIQYLPKNRGNWTCFLKKPW